MNEQNGWRWFGSAGHFICASRCRFHLCTEVGEYFVSTVGELYLTPDAESMEPLGAGEDSLYETMVFKCGADRCECGCGLPLPGEWLELDGQRYATAADANAGHLRYCEQYAAKEPSDA